MDIKIPKMGQGPAKPATEQDIKKRKVGFTHEDLQRDVNPQPPKNDAEVKPRDYTLSIQGYDSYRTTEIVTHDEDQKDREIP